ncbi:MAG: EAL domain-containing protein [Acidobacteriia bacterium]|nr:EAL domain-containing protein [Terriglobia bacterium]
MSVSRAEDALPRDGAQGSVLPVLPDLFERIGDSLAERGRLGILSITVLERNVVDCTGGWHAYDRVVRTIARFLDRYRARRLRRDDRVFEPSLSGNAFVLVLGPPRAGRPVSAEDLAGVRERLRRGLRFHLGRSLPRDVLDRFSCYVGGALMTNDPGIRLDRIVYRSLDEAFADALAEKAVEDRGLTDELSRILRLGLVRTVYQPVVDVSARRIIGYEALSRVPRVRFDSVDLLFKAAHDHDTLFTLERLCRLRAIERVPGIAADQVLFLNVEPDGLHDPEFTDGTFLRRLGDAGLAPSQIVLEITEHTRVRDFTAFRRTLGQLRSSGLRLAMDDVGSGYAGLQSIAEIAPEFIKVDMTLVRDLDASTIKRELITTIRRFADATGIGVVAEGVERVGELVSLMETGVRCAQGYLFARPDSPPRHPDWDSLGLGD